MSTYMIIKALKYAFTFIKTHFWALLKMVVVFIAIVAAVGLIVTGSSLILLSALSNNIWLTVALESPLLAVVGYGVYGMWNVSFVTYLLALERAGSASVGDQLKKSFSTRVLELMLLDITIVLFFGTNALVWGGAALGTWWFNGMQLGLWHRVALGVAGVLLLGAMLCLLVRLLFAKIVIADTGADLFTALSASWSATKGHFWRLFVLLFVVGVISSVFTALAAHLSQLIAVLVGGSLGNLLGKVLEVLAAIINIVITPLITLYYYLQMRVAKSLVAGR